MLYIKPVAVFLKVPKMMSFENMQQMTHKPLQRQFLASRHVCIDMIGPVILPALYNGGMLAMAQAQASTRVS